MTTTPQTSSSTASAQSRTKVAGRAAAVAALIGVVANLVIYGIARLVDVDLLIPESPGSDVMTRLEPVLVIVASIVPVVLAAVVAVALGRWLPARGRQVFTVLVAVGLVGSFAPIATGGLSAGTVVALSLMHLVVAAAVVAFLSRLADSTRT